MSVLKYPYRPVSPEGRDEEYPTEATDYVMFHRYRISYDDYAQGYKGLNVPNSKVLTDDNKERVYLAMPKGISTSYSPSYSKVDMGVAGVMASALAGEGSTGGLNFDKVASTITAGAQAILPEATANMISKVSSSLNNLSGGGGGPNANQITAVAQGRVFNPFSEQIFNSMGFRSHNFSFKLYARSKKEATEIRKIVTYLKEGTAPKIAGGSANLFDLGSGEGLANTEGLSAEQAQQRNQEVLDSINNLGETLNQSRYFEVPDKYRIKFVRMSPNVGSSTIRNPELMFKVNDSVCTGMSVNYTPDGQYTSFKDVEGLDGHIHVPVIQIDMSFTETKVISQADLRAGY